LEQSNGFTYWKGNARTPGIKWAGTFQREVPTVTSPFFFSIEQRINHQVRSNIVHWTGAPLYIGKGKKQLKCISPKKWRGDCQGSEKARGDAN